MFLVYRPAGLTDLNECQYCLRDNFAYSDDTRKQLVALWERLLRNGEGGIAVIEDRMRPPGESILWCCFKVFVTPEYAHYLKTEAAPIPALQMLEHRLTVRLPLLNAEQVRKKNSPDEEGITMLVLNSGFSPHATKLNEPDWALLVNKMIEFNYYFCAGYNFRELLIEMYDDFTYQWADGAGLHLRTDYSHYYAMSAATVPPAHQYPKLFGVTPAEGRQAFGRIFGAIMDYRKPIFGFTESEQELLFRALLDETDEESAEALCVSVNTLKKRWNLIYQRIQLAASEVIEPSQNVAPDSIDEIGSMRGKEKKRRVIAYLRHHLEELRPYIPRPSIS